MRRNRSGFSLIELVVCVAVLGILIGLTLGAIQRVRAAALRLQNKNNLRQIILTTHVLAAETDDKLEYLVALDTPFSRIQSGYRSLFWRLAFIFQGIPKDIILGPGTTPEQADAIYSPDVKCYRNPADISWDYGKNFSQFKRKISYAYNFTALSGDVHFFSSIPDGTSSTIAFTEKYTAKTQPGEWNIEPPYIRHTLADYAEAWRPSSEDAHPISRRPTFADAGWLDSVPAKHPTTGEVICLPRGIVTTFQVCPRPEEVDPGVPQSSIRGGLEVALFDGSVRTISERVSESTFWSMVTHNGGEVVPSD